MLVLPRVSLTGPNSLLILFSILPRRRRRQPNAELTCKAVLAKQGWREVCHDKGKLRDKGRCQVELDVLRSFFNSFEADIGRFGMFDSNVLLLVLSDIQQK